jgi:type I restriction enzyme R subunit
LDQDKLTPLLQLRYQNSIRDASADLGQPQALGAMFEAFQKHLYQPQPWV